MKSLAQHVIIKTFLIALAGLTLQAGETAERLNYQVILPSSPTQAQQFAATELSAFLEKNYSEPVMVRCRCG